LEPTYRDVSINGTFNNRTTNRNNRTRIGRVELATTDTGREVTAANKYRTTMEKLAEILTELEQGKISADNAEMRVLDLFVVSGSLHLDKVDQLLKMQIEECRYFAQRCARDYGAASADYDK
jgi:hypothetical protein